MHCDLDCNNIFHTDSVIPLSPARALSGSSNFTTRPSALVATPYQRSIEVKFSAQPSFLRQHSPPVVWYNRRSTPRSFSAEPTGGDANQDQASTTSHQSRALSRDVPPVCMHCTKNRNGNSTTVLQFHMRQLGNDIYCRASSVDPSLPRHRAHHLSLPPLHDKIPVTREHLHMPFTHRDTKT